MAHWLAITPRAQLIQRMDEGCDRVADVSEHPAHARVKEERLPVPRGSGEIIDAFSADELRKLPSMRLRMVLSGTRAGQEQTIGEYGLEHAGSMTR